MRKIWGAILVCLLLYTSGLQAAALLKTNINFYGNTVTLLYDNSINVPYSKFNLHSPEIFAGAMGQTNYQVTLASLQAQKTNLQLNDWQYLQLVRQASAQLFPKKDESYRTLFSWFMMLHSGYNVLLLSSYTRPYLFVRSNDHVFGLPYVENENGRFVNVSAFFDSRIQMQEMQSLSPDYKNYNPQGRIFIFNIRQLPTALKPQPVDKWLQFAFNGQKYKIHILGDKSVVNYMRNYPDLGVKAYEDIPLSKYAYQSLIPAFQAILKDKGDAEAVRILLSFTRTAFVYKTDMDAYHKENLMFSPEETLLSDYSDCEDRAILFAYLAKELLGLKTIYVEYPNHLMVGVKLPGVEGMTVEYNGEKYAVCEPTGPQDELEIGEIPPRFEDVNVKLNPL